MSPLRVLRGLIFGAIGGLVGWLLTEFLPFGYPFRPHLYEGPDSAMPTTLPHIQALLGFVLGLSIGGFLGVSEGVSEGTQSRFKRAFLAFLVVGAFGGFVGMYCGQVLFALMGGEIDPRRIAPSAFLWQLMARSLAWMLIGLFMGVAFGVPNMSFRRMWNGMVGGAIGGFLGGMLFQLMAFTGLFAGMQNRFVGFTLIGAMIGFFINLIAEAMKRVWVKVLIGRNEGREHVLDTAVAYVGRDELAEVPVFLDPSVPKRMASFRLNNGRYALYAESNALPVQVNGQPLQQGQVLRDGDAIQFGRVTLGYNEKATATGYQRPVDTVALADYSAPSVVPGATPIPTTPGVCEFCGQPRDPATGACACSVPADAGFQQPGGYPPAGAYGPPGYDPGGYAQAPTMAYPPPGGYPPQDFSGGYGAPDPAYAATMMDPGTGGGYAPGVGGGHRLTTIAGPLAGQVFPLMAMEAGIGREPGNDIPLVGDTTASRRHARVLQLNGTWVLRDEGSSNGTWVNGVRIQEQPLFPGDVIRIGQTEFRFEA